MTERKRYDCVVIGAGVAGLAAGCHMARAGTGVLVAEAHTSAGGYCSSFVRDGFTLDTGIHALVNCRPDGMLGGQIARLGLAEFCEIRRADPSDIIEMPDYRVRVWNDSAKTVDELSRAFPGSRQRIRSFFAFMRDAPYISLYARYRSRTFASLLDEHFDDERLKAFFAVVSMNIGLPPTRSSAVAALILVREHLLDGGYYAVGGMQRFPDALCRSLARSGGTLRLGARASGIDCDTSGRVTAVRFSDGSRVETRTVIAACDANTLFTKLLGGTGCDGRFLSHLASLEPSGSCLVAHLLLDGEIGDGAERCRAVWANRSYDLEGAYRRLALGDVGAAYEHAVYVFPSRHDRTLAPAGRDYLYVLMNMPYLDHAYWAMRRDEVTDEVISKARERFPSIGPHIAGCHVATPHTFERYTGNTRGAFRGWASTVAQFGASVMPAKTPIEGLFLAGHWTTTSAGQGGVSVSVYSGSVAAKHALRGLGAVRATGRVA